MKFEQLTPELQAWMRTMREGGYTREAVHEALVAAKYQARHASEVISAAWAHLPAPPGPAIAPVRAAVDRTAIADATAATGSVGQSGSSELTRMSNTLSTSDRAVEMLFVLRSPRVVLFGNLLSDAECDEMIELSRGRVQRSSVVNESTGAYDVHPHRTSSGTHFRRGENELLRRIEQRIATLIDCPVECGEPIQVLHYEPGDEYRPHFDYFDPTQTGNRSVLALGGQRIATLIMYLNDVTSGGSTVCPEIGLDVLPRRGHAVYFAYCDEQGALDNRTLHGGNPVVLGEKWIATKWLRQSSYTGPGI